METNLKCTLVLLALRIGIDSAATSSVAASSSVSNKPTGDTGMSGAVKAFPTAEGFGAHALGGRGGRVIEVTNLEDLGEGSLRAAMEASGPRICVFRVSGTITLKDAIRVRTPYLTVAGQTSPGGIEIKGNGQPRATGAFGLSMVPMILWFATCVCGWAAT